MLPIQELLLDLLILQTKHKNLIKDPNNQPHPQKTLRLAIWKVSGGYTLQSEFWTKLQNCRPQAGAPDPLDPAIRKHGM